MKTPIRSNGSYKGQWADHEHCQILSVSGSVTKGLMDQFPGYMHPGFSLPGLERCLQKILSCQQVNSFCIWYVFVCNSNHMKGVEIPKSLRDYWKTVVKNQPAEVLVQAPSLTNGMVWQWERGFNCSCLSFLAHTMGIALPHRIDVRIDEIIKLKFFTLHLKPCILVS